MKKDIGSYLNEIRKSKLISLRELSQKMELGNEGHVYLSDIERGNRNAPTGANVKKDYI